MSILGTMEITDVNVKKGSLSTVMGELAKMWMNAGAILAVATFVSILKAHFAVNVIKDMLSNKEWEISCSVLMRMNVTEILVIKPVPTQEDLICVAALLATDSMLTEGHAQILMNVPHHTMDVRGVA